MSKAQNSNPGDEPRVPEGPTVPAAANATQEAESAAVESDGEGRAMMDPDRARPNTAKGGRKPWPELAEENRVLAERVAVLRQALRPLAALPDDGVKPPQAVLYTLVRDGRQGQITCGDIRTARELLG